jgi:hypothetical protein
LKTGSTARLAAAALWLAASGCTALREVPRSQYAAQPERRNVRVMTRDSLQYEFERARFAADSLVGYHRRDVEGPVEEYSTVKLALDDVSRLTTRRVDWYRTGLIGGVGLAAILAAALSRAGGDGGPPADPNPCAPRPCP